VVTGSDESMRVSDAERDATVRTLGEQAAVGRLTLAELEDRAGQALTAKTRGELAVLTSDLPQDASQGSQSAPAARARKPVRWLIAVMGGSHRRGRFRAVGSINANLFALMGGANIYLPDSIDLEVGGLSLMGGHEEVGSQRSPRPGAPLVRIRLYNLMSGATIYRLPPQANGLSLKEARRLAKLAERGALTPPE
jgi:hypothetical protein